MYMLYSGTHMYVITKVYAKGFHLLKNCQPWSSDFCL